MGEVENYCTTLCASDCLNFLCSKYFQHKTYIELASNGGGGGEAKGDLQESCE